ncbi:MAG: hypothetical protein RL088_3255 [Verrucomicrobiota bacterium]|jgi:6-phosphogluconolactonase
MKNVILSMLMSTPLIAADLSFYVGTYTKGGASEGIYHGTLNTETGEAKLLGLAGKAENPSFVAIHPNRKFLYAVVEDNGGAVGAFAIEKDGTLRKLNTGSTKHSGNCHVWVDSTGKNALAASYGSGTIASLPIKEDGSLGEATAIIQHVGSGPDKSRQEKPHAHAIYQNGAFVYACDLGTDDVFIYKFDADKGTLTPHTPKSGRVPAGGGPRHLAFHPKGGFAYVNSEMTSAVTTFVHDAEKGTLDPVQTLSTLPEDYATPKNSSTAEIHCRPDGKFVYVSNRGHDSIAVFAVGADGKLTKVEIADAKVKVPRGFGISPDGKWLIAAGQSSNDLALHAIDAARGKLTFKSIIGKVGAPVNVEFVK